MAKRVTLNIAGLVTDPNPLMTGEQGALRRADDVVVLDTGVLAGRPRLAEHASSESIYQPRALRYFDDVVLTVGEFEGNWLVETDSGDILGNAEPPDFDLSPTQFAEARQSLYYTTSTGVRKLTSGGVSASDVAGVEMLVSAFTMGYTAGSGPFTNASQWTYRLVFVKTDANGYIRRSPPSAPILGVGGDAEFFIDWQSSELYRVHIPSWLEVGDQIEAYRTRLSGDILVAPSPEHYLAFSYTVTSDDVTNGYCVFPDDWTADDALGAALYTNPTQGGIVSAKEPPPMPVALATWNGCMWFGNTIERHRLEVRLIDVTDGTVRTGLQYVFNASVDFTSGSPTVTGLSTVDGMVVGMALSSVGASPAGTGTYIPQGTYVLAISGSGPYSITMSNNALATGTSLLTAHDVLEIGGVEFYPAIGQYAPGYFLSDERCFNPGDGTSVMEERLARTAYALAACVNVYATLNESTFPIRAYNLGDVTNPFGSFAPGAILFEEIGVGGSSFSFESVTRPLAVNPTTATGPLESVADECAVRLFWSEIDEPEAVPLGQYVDVGNPREPILALVPLRSALLVFKTGGVYRVSGAPPDAWTVELLDSSTKLLRGGLVDVSENVAIALCESGVEAVDENGSHSISDGRIGRELRELTQVFAEEETHGAFVVAWDAAHCVLVGVPLEAEDEATTYIYCYSIPAQAWTKWHYRATAATSSGNSGRVYLAKSGGWNIRETDRGFVDAAFSGFDDERVISGWTYDAGGPSVRVTQEQRGEWRPKICDWVSGVVGAESVFSQYRRIVDVAVDQDDYILTLASAFEGTPTDQFRSYETIVSVVQWQAHVAGTPFETALYREMQLALDLSRVVDTMPGDVHLELGASTDRTAEPTIVNVNVPRRDVEPASEPVRAMVPREVARSTHLYPYLEMCNVKLPWRCLGLALVLEPVSERTAR